MLNQVNKENGPQKVIIWGTSASPYVRKVMVALAEKNISYEQKEILPKILLKATGQPIPADFDAASPLGKIPALQINDFTLSDSAVIAAYLDKKFTSGNKLYPTDPEEYAIALWFEHYADNILTEVIYKKIFLECIVKAKILNQEPNHNLVKEAKNIELPPVLDYLNKSLEGKEWFAGNHFSMADVAISTQLLALMMTEYEMDHKEWPNLNNFLKKIIERPSFKKIVAR